MLELLMSVLCVGSAFNPDACSQAWNKENSENENISVFEKNLQKDYYDDQPNAVKYSGAIAAVFYKRELRFKVYHEMFIDIKDEGRILVGTKWTF